MPITSIGGASHSLRSFRVDLAMLEQDGKCGRGTLLKGHKCVRETLLTGA